MKKLLVGFIVPLLMVFKLLGTGTAPAAVPAAVPASVVKLLAKAIPDAADNLRPSAAKRWSRGMHKLKDASRPLANYAIKDLAKILGEDFDVCLYPSAVKYSAGPEPVACAKLRAKLEAGEFVDSPGLERALKNILGKREDNNYARYLQRTFLLIEQFRFLPNSQQLIRRGETSDINQHQSTGGLM